MPLEARIEALLFASGRPLSIAEISRCLGPELGGRTDDIREAVRLLRMEFERRKGGFLLVEVGGGFEFRTNPRYASDVLRLTEKKPPKLSSAALETLAIVAYRQPVTRALVEELRGVDSSASIRTLLDRDLVSLAGRSREPGRPHYYRTTKGFLRTFGLASLKDLPNKQELEELSQGHLFQTDPESDVQQPDEGQKDT